MGNGRTGRFSGNKSSATVSLIAEIARSMPSGERGRAVKAGSIVGDHLGTPPNAYGYARVNFAAVTEENKPFVLNLRLPGKVFDAETNLHYNHLRDYDPALGRCTTPDPIGLAGGLNPYSYASNNPLTNIDPLGLYESDVRYYVPFFLAAAVGFNLEDVRTIALATQYIDDNPLTRPIDVDETGDEKYVYSILHHQRRLLYYHFTLSDGVTGRTEAEHESEPSFEQPESAIAQSTKCRSKVAIRR